MRFNPLMTAIFTGAIFMESVDVMAGDVPVSVVSAASMMKQSSVETLKDDTRVFNINKNIQVFKVMFTNRYGFDVAGHLYLPKNFNSDQKLWPIHHLMNITKLKIG